MRFALVAVVLVSACRFDFDARTSDGSVSHDSAVADSARDAYYDLVMSDHPVAYWRLGDKDEVAKDELAAHDAIYSGGIAEGQVGALTVSPNTATAFDGLSGEAESTKAIRFPNQQPFTLEIWVNETASQTYWHFLTDESRVLGMPQAGYALLQAGTGVMFERIANPGQYDQTNVSLIPAGTWVHVAGVYDGSAVTLYIDGVAHQTAPAPEPADDFDSPVFIGAHVDGAFFSGTLDEAAIYDHALTQQELLKHYEVAVGP